MPCFYAIGGQDRYSGSRALLQHEVYGGYEERLDLTVVHDTKLKGNASAKGHSKLSKPDSLFGEEMLAFLPQSLFLYNYIIANAFLFLDD